MEITKTHHDSGTGIHTESIPVKTKEDFKVAQLIGDEMVEWLDKTNGSFDGQHKSALAIGHCQVVDHDHPWRMFVVDKDLLLPEKLDKDSKQNTMNSFFESRVIFNAEILEVPEKIEKEIPQRKVIKDPNNKLKVQVSVEIEKKEISNVITVPEACMRFPKRKEKNMDRYYQIKVRYQYHKKTALGVRVKTFTGWVSSLKAHILQHEIDHFNGVNIYHGKQA